MNAMAAGRMLVGVISLAAIHKHSALLVSIPEETDTCDKTCLMDTAGIRSSLSTMPRRSLSDHERSVLDDDGVVLLRSVVTNRKVLKTLEERIWKIIDLEMAVGDKHRMQAYKWNAAVRALVEDDLFASLSASAFPSGEVPSFRDMRYSEAPVWGFQGTSDGKTHRTPTGYHFDAAHQSSNGHSCEMITLWLALTDGATYPLEFVKKSHKVRKELETRCATWHLNAVANITWAAYDKDCSDQFVGNATRQPGPAWSTDMQAGDVFLFTGNTLHLGVEQPGPRLAISLRYTSPEVGGKRCLVPDYHWHPPGQEPTPV